jgi:hypothetical protein
MPHGRGVLISISGEVDLCDKKVELGSRGARHLPLRQHEDTSRGFFSPYTDLVYRCRGGVVVDDAALLMLFLHRARPYLSWRPFWCYRSQCGAEVAHRSREGACTLPPVMAARQRCLPCIGPDASPDLVASA